MAVLQIQVDPDPDPTLKKIGSVSFIPEKKMDPDLT